MEIEVFFDGACPLCRREIDLLGRLDRGRGKIKVTDIAAADFDPEAIGVPFATLMDEIHGRLPDGTLIKGVEVFRRLYGAVGFGPAVWLSRLPGVRQLADVAYRAFAKHRLRLTGRCQDDVCAPKAT